MTHRILVVDDDHDMAKTLSEILQLQGWQVSVAHDGLEAVRAFEAQPFDAVLMDVRMPVMNGVAAFKAMKALRPDVKVVLMTAFAAQEMLADAEENGVLRILSKPVDIRSLLALLAGTLARKGPVLLIDDDRAFLRTLSEVLELRGFETVVASSLDQAVARMEEQRPAAILLHMHLGPTSAREAVLAVAGSSAEAPLILYSGQPGARNEIDGDVPEDLVHAYLQKPFAIEKVAGVLSEVVGD